MMSARPATAPPGSPPATILASTHRSGMTPKRACAPPRDQRKPVITSSKISSDAVLLASRRAGRRGNPSGSGTMPHEAPDRFEDHGGDVVARSQRFGDDRHVIGRQQDRLLDRGRRNARRHASRRNATCEPAATWSCQPWKWPTKRTILGLPVKARARRSARCEASVPDAVKRTRSAQGIRRLHQLGPAHFHLVRGAPVRALRHLGLHRLDHGRMRVAEQQRAVPAEVVDVLVAVDVPLARSRRARRIDRIGQQRAAIVGQPGRDDLAGLGVKLRGARVRARYSVSILELVKACMITAARLWAACPISPATSSWSASRLKRMSRTARSRRLAPPRYRIAAP